MANKREKIEEKKSEPASTFAQFEFRWIRILVGVLLIAFGYTLPSLATFYIANFGNHIDSKDVVISAGPKVQGRNNFDLETQYQKRSLNHWTQTPGVSLRKSVENNSFQKAKYKISDGSVHSLLALQTIESDSDANSNTATPGPTITPKTGSQPETKNKSNFIVKIFRWFTGLFKKKKKPVLNQPAQLNSLKLSTHTVTLPCAQGENPASGSCSDETSVQIETSATDPENDVLSYAYTVDAGRISGQGPTVTWDLKGVPEGLYVVTASVEDGIHSGVTKSERIEVRECDCSPIVVKTPSPIPTRTPIPSPHGNVSGIVMDSSGIGIPGVTVNIMSEDGFSQSVTTDSEGRFAFSFLRAGRYTILVRSAGFSVFSSELYVEVGQTTPMPLVLNSDATDTNTRPPLGVSPNTGSNGSSNSGDDTVPNDNSNINAGSNSNSNTDNTNTMENSVIPPILTVKDKNGTDRISYDYPIYFLRDRPNLVNLELDYVTESVTTNTSTVNVNGVPTNTVSNLGVHIPVAPRGYDIWVIATLIPKKNLEPVFEKKKWKKYVKTFKRGQLKWQWKLTPKGSAKDSEAVKFTLRLDYGFRKISQGEPDVFLERTNIFKPDLAGQVGLPLFVWLLAYFSVPAGVLLSFAGVFKVNVFGRGTELVLADEKTAAVDVVNCTLYAPPDTKAGNEFLVQVFAHLEEQAENLAEIAQMSDVDSREQAVRALDQPVLRGSKLTFQLVMSNVEIDEPVQLHTWNGKVVEVPFIVRVPAETVAGIKIGKVIVSENDVPVGRLTFRIIVADGIATLVDREKLLTVETINRFRHAFVSYASEDRPKVLARVQMLSAAKIDYFQDILSLDPGERWEKELYKYIDKCDVVFLFWSNAASKSQWVEKEILYALARQQGDESAPPEIIPIIIEGPPSAEPPDSLRFLHFNDKFAYMILAADMESEVLRNREERSTDHTK